MVVSLLTNVSILVLTRFSPLESVSPPIVGDNFGYGNNLKGLERSNHGSWKIGELWGSSREGNRRVFADPGCHQAVSL